ncbi:MAG: GNAT family N-acetyltransferase [Bacteroidales bacterium]|jgi:hypothetical protein|nr:GNAT family N-acetyltransferase [Bacteroidales bacterium]
MKNNNKESKYTNSVFEQPWWLDTVAPGKWKEILYKENEDIIARLSVVENKSTIYMPKLTQNIGVWIDENVIKNDKSYKKQRKIYSFYAKEIDKYKTFRIRLNTNNKYFLPFIWKDFVVSPNVTYRIENLSNIDDIYNKFSSNLKRRIKVAQKEVTIEASNDVDILISLIEKTYSIQNRKISEYEKKEIKDIFYASMEHQACKLLYAKDNQNNYHSGALFVYDENVMYYLLGGTDPKYRRSGAHPLILWEGIKLASNLSKVFDFEGSMIESIEDFFRQFGGEQCVYYTIEKRSIFQHVFMFYRRKIKRIIGYKQ